MTAGHVEWLDRLIGGKRTNKRRRMEKECLTRQCVNFNAETEIRSCGCVGGYFPTRLPLEGRSERGAPIGVLVGWNGGNRKKLLAIGCSNGGSGFCEAS